ncbi:uncharacterized protein LOC115450719 [Manduca sexta]|uniref:uncharacterized protein LOC115450719 n=1 Tax=Manduca sexta TaxID=7130 RepID=UPI00188DFC9E|nr:uncharacterized protein LOC115450719 [Manduca sexta]
MFSSFDVCLALDCVKKICENNRCIVCDKESEEFLRYSCGHTVCVSCASGTDSCYSCLTSADESTSNYKLDEVSGQRAVNASVLLKEFEKAFNVNVFNHQRMSAQLKLEKDIFPECIQAPRKYFNKRKSLNLNVKKKKNRISLLPGEIVSEDSYKMENSITSVQKWLNRNKENVFEIQNVNKDEHDESGIVIDASYMDCSQITVDKDKQALLAVYEADKKERTSVSVLTVDSEEWEDNNATEEHPKILKDEYKVPFFKKSKLAETYVVCDNDTNIVNRSSNNCGQNSSIQITISFDNQHIKPCEFLQKESLHAHSSSVQTDICEFINMKDNLEDPSENSSLYSKQNVPSQDVFTPEELHKVSKDDISNIGFKAAMKSVIINESDSDGSVAEAAILEVSAQVHNVENPVFSDITFIDSHEQFRRQQRRRPRHLTPDSSNSSEKENLNPNKRQKKSKPVKKSKK